MGVLFNVLMVMLLPEEAQETRTDVPPKSDTVMAEAR